MVHVLLSGTGHLPLVLGSWHVGVVTRGDISEGEHAFINIVKIQGNTWRILLTTLILTTS